MIVLSGFRLMIRSFCIISNVVLVYVARINSIFPLLVNRTRRIWIYGNACAFRRPGFIGHSWRATGDSVKGNYQPDALTDTGDNSATVTASEVVALSPLCHRRRKRRRLLTGVSRQRRAANTRERVRIQGVNSAYVILKNTLPVVQPEDVSKIETLRLASKWIAYLTTVLIQDDQRLTHSPVSERRTVPESVRARLLELLHFEIEDFDLVETRSLLTPDVTPDERGSTDNDVEFTTSNLRFDVMGEFTETTEVQYAMCNAFTNITCNETTETLRTPTQQRETRLAKRSTYNDERSMDPRDSVTFDMRYPNSDNVAGLNISDRSQGIRTGVGPDDRTFHSTFGSAWLCRSDAISLVDNNLLPR